MKPRLCGAYDTIVIQSSAGAGKSAAIANHRPNSMQQCEGGLPQSINESLIQRINIAFGRDHTQPMRRMSRKPIDTYVPWLGINQQWSETDMQAKNGTWLCKSGLSPVSLQSSLIERPIAKGHWRILPRQIQTWNLNDKSRKRSLWNEKGLWTSRPFRADLWIVRSN